MLPSLPYTEQINSQRMISERAVSSLLSERAKDSKYSLWGCCVEELSAFLCHMHEGSGVCLAGFVHEACTFAFLCEARARILSYGIDPFGTDVSYASGQNNQQNDQ